MGFFDKIKKLPNDIRFWIILFLLIRLVGITNPPLEVSHNWRQTSVTMVARNFYEVSPNILYPRIDVGGNTSGITGMEFPFLNYLIYLVSCIFGYTHWYGRLINLVVSSLGIFYFFNLTRKFFTEKVSFYATLVLLASIWFDYSRKIMPDTFSVSLTIIGLYYGITYLLATAPRILDLILYLSFGMLGILSKIPAGYLLVFVLPLIFRKDIWLKTKILFSVATLLMSIPIIFWYFYWVQKLTTIDGLSFFMGRNVSQAIIEIYTHLNDALAHFYDYALKYTGFAGFLLGLIFAIIKKDRKLLMLFGLGFMAFLMVIFKAGFYFTHHSYYIIPFVPVMALVCGYGIASLGSKKIRVILTLAIVLEGILSQQHNFFLTEKQQAIAGLEKVMDKFSDPHDLVVINSNENPTPIYFTHRKGWTATNDQIMDTGFMKDVRAKGGKFLIILKRYLGENTNPSLIKIFENENYSIYKF
ncbi:MAG: glycosyltransferase family 39 protein [Bacteroidota bacterium]